VSLVVACLARNEADRFWRSALEAWSAFADRIVVLDDDSDDNRQVYIAEEVCGDKLFYFFRNARSTAWGQESPARAKLWELAEELSEPGDYIFVLDADMTPARDPRPLLQAEPAAVAFPLYDLWDTRVAKRPWYRSDYFWQGHRHPRIWLVRRPDQSPEGGWSWNERGIHCGHLPSNLAYDPARVVVAPREYALLHYAYSSPALRQAKAARYEAVADKLTDFERAHARSILDPDPPIFPLPFTPELVLQLATLP